MNTKLIIFTIVLAFAALRVNSQPGCPGVDAGLPQTLTCTTPCTDLIANVIATGTTTSYSVTSIPYAPPAPYNAGTPILVAIDDQWSPAINLPFSFCFYGNLYTQAVAGSNGLISFDLTANAPGAYCAYSLSSGTTIPTSTYPVCSVMGTYEDIDPTNAGGIYYQLIGTAPCRMLVVSYFDVPFFGSQNSVSTSACATTALTATSEIVLYESTNIIEVYNQNKPDCPGWNGGLAIEGIQDDAGVNAVAVPGRNNTVWTATNDAWRFTPSGPTNYAVSWWQGATQIATTDTINVCPTSTTQYTAQVIYNLCTGSQLTLQDTVTVSVSNSIGLTISPANPVICGGGSATLTATSTNPLATFAWNTGPTTATITVSPTATTTYTVTATTPGCTTTASTTVTVSNNPTISITSPTICLGQSATLTASGATTYIWNTGGTTAAITVTPTVTTTYTVTGSNTGCTGTGSVTVTVITSSSTATSTNETCGLSNGTATASVAGCTYVWSTVPAQTTQTATNLPAGTYTVTVTCGGCTATATTSLINLASPTLAITNVVNSSCGLSNGSATATIAGGTAPYLYTWNSAPVQNTQTMSNVPAGTYDVTITDVNGCSATNTVTLTTTNAPIPTVSGIITANCYIPDGGATVNVTGGTSPYSYMWNSVPAQTTAIMQNVVTGNYIVTVTDASGCTATASAFVPDNPGPTATTSSTDEICNQHNGTASVVASGGALPYTYLWNCTPLQVGSTATGLVAGSYVVTVTDANGCTVGAVASLPNIPGPTAGFTINPRIVTVIENTVSFADNSSGNIVSWMWSFGDGTLGGGSHLTHNYPYVGSYPVTLIVTDNNGCTDTVTDTVKVKDIFTFYVPNAFTPNNDNLNDLFYASGNSVDPNSFDMSIFDRWGNLIFHTTTWNVNKSEAWNGTKNNSGNSNDVIMGTYVYRVKLKELAGIRHEYIGKISIIP